MKLQFVLAVEHLYVATLKILSSSFLQFLFIVRNYEVSIVRERNKLVHYSTACSAFCRDESDCLYQLFSPMYYLPVAFTFTIDFDQFEFQLMHDQNQLFCLDLQNFKSLESGDVHQNFWSSESLALGLQNLQVSFIVRDSEVSVVREREKLVHYSTLRTLLFAGMIVTACTNFSVLCTIYQSLVLSPLTLINLNFK